MLEVDDEAAGGIGGTPCRRDPIPLILRKNCPNRGISVPKSILFDLRFVSIGSLFMLLIVPAGLFR